MVLQLLVIVIVCAAFGAAAARGVGGTRLILVAGVLGFGIFWTAMAGWIPKDFSTLGLFIAAIAGGIAVGRKSLATKSR